MWIDRIEGEEKNNVLMLNVESPFKNHFGTMFNSNQHPRKKKLDRKYMQEHTDEV